MITNIIKVVVLFSLVLFSCTEKVEPKPYTYTQIFTGKKSKTWKVDQLIFRQEAEDDVVYSLATCEKDDLYTFYANDERLLEVSNAASKCEGDDPEDLLISYKWEFNQGYAALSMVFPHIFGYYFIPFIVKEADNNSIELEIYVDETATSSYIIKLKLVSEE